MTLEVADFLLLIGITSGITTASTVVMIYKITEDKTIKICNQISRIHERINSLAVRVGVHDAIHNNTAPNDLK